MTATRSPICAALICLALSFSASAQNATDKARAEFQQAYAQALTGAAGDEATDSERLRRYALYPYLQSVRLQTQLVKTSGALQDIDERAHAFIAAHAEEPVIRDLSHTWLVSLAERSLWQPFLDNYRPTEDDTLRCDYFVARIETQKTDGLAALVSQKYLTPSQLPQPCEVAFTWLRAHDGVTPAMFDQRVRMVLRQGNVPFARQLIAQVPAEQTTALRRWAALIQQPQAEIEAAIATPNEAIENEALLDGWARFARARPDLAQQRYSSFIAARQLDRNQASPYALIVALRLAWNRSSGALDYFDLVQPADRDERAFEWQARAALWSSDWDVVRRTIAAMPAALRDSSRWRYWLARAYESGKDRDGARDLYMSLLKDDNYYSALAAAHLEQPVEPHPIETPKDSATVGALAKIDGFIRARELFHCNLRDYALTEWAVASAKVPDTHKTQLIHLADSWGWYDLAIETSVQQKLYNDYRLLFPHPFDDEVDAAAQRTGLERDFIYGVMRQESRYRAEAVSSAGAMGLLQLMPETAKLTARQMQLPQYSQASLLTPKTNILLGAWHLKTLDDRFSGQAPVVLAGYNAGPVAASRWLPEDRMDADIWIENIPYNETRSYVQRVLWQQTVFAWLRSGKAQDTKDMLAAINPVTTPRLAVDR